MQNQMLEKPGLVIRGTEQASRRQQSVWEAWEEVGGSCLESRRNLQLESKLVERVRPVWQPGLLSVVACEVRGLEHLPVWKRGAASCVELHSFVEIVVGLVAAVRRSAVQAVVLPDLGHVFPQPSQVRCACQYPPVCWQRIVGQCWTRQWEPRSWCWLRRGGPSLRRWLEQTLCG